MQHELTEGDLHDARGHLIERGWAPAERRRYRRAAITAPWWRIKEWDYYCVLADDYGIGFVIADNGYMGLISATWLDFRNRTETTTGAIPLFTRGRLGLPESADAGDVAASHKGMAMAFHLTQDADGTRHRRLVLDCPAFDGGKGLSGEIRLRQPVMDRMVIATPFPESPRAFYYNQKINCMPADGTVTVAGRDYSFSPDRNFAVLDWGRGVWAYDNVWYWGSASGLTADGRPVGFNIGYGFGDTSAASENMVFLDGKAHKLDQVTFHIPERDGARVYDEMPWRFSSNDGRFELEFAPIFDRADAVDLLVLRSITHQVFGRFSGTVVLDGGERLEIRDLLGFAEEVRNRW